MKLKFLFLLALCSVALHSTAIAEGRTGNGLKNRSDDQNCALEKTPLTRCETLREYAKRDSELNKEYRKLTKQLKNQSLSALKTTQRERIKWRDEKCDDVEEAANCTNGVCAGVSHDYCIVELTEKRTSELAVFSRQALDVQPSQFAFDKSYKE
jgi:uncharacterized protein YecT (DUF1311 family)